MAASTAAPSAVEMVLKWVAQTDASMAEYSVGYWDDVKVD